MKYTFILIWLTYILSIQNYPLVLTREEALKSLAHIYPFVKLNHIVIAQINELLLQASYCNDGNIQDELHKLGLTLLYDTMLPHHVENDELYDFFSSKGFRGQIFVDNERNLYPVIRGTAFPTMGTILNNLMTDFTIIRDGEFNESYRECIHQFAHIVSHCASSHKQISIHGHSLGGAAATYLGFILGLTLTENTIIVCASDPIGIPRAIDRALHAYNTFRHNKMIVTLDNLLSVITHTPFEQYQSPTELYRLRKKFIKNHFKSRVLFLNFLFALMYTTTIHLSPVATLHPQLGEVFLLLSSQPPEAASTLYNLLAWETLNPNPSFFSLVTGARIAKWLADSIKNTQAGTFLAFCFNYAVENMTLPVVHGLTIGHAFRVLSTFHHVMALHKPLQIVSPLDQQIKKFYANVIPFQELLLMSKPFGGLVVQEK